MDRDKARTHRASLLNLKPLKKWSTTNYAPFAVRTSVGDGSTGEQLAGSSGSSREEEVKVFGVQSAQLGGAGSPDRNGRDKARTHRAPAPHAVRTSDGTAGEQLAGSSGRNGHG